MRLRLNAFLNGVIPVFCPCSLMIKQRSSKLSGVLSASTHFAKTSRYRGSRGKHMPRIADADATM